MPAPQAVEDIRGTVSRALKRLATDLGSPGHDGIYGAGRVGTGY